MSVDCLTKLSALSSAQELQRAIEPLCQRFGRIQNIRIIKDNSDGSHFCFIDLDSAEANAALMRQFGGTHFGNGVVFRIPLKRPE